jgi:hypothetical protein
MKMHYLSWCLVFLLVFTIILFPLANAEENESILLSSPDFPVLFGEKTKINISNSWKEKLSSDLLQLVDPLACSPGRKPGDIANDMELLGQLRYDAQNSPEVPITIILTADTAAKNITSYLNDTAIDLSFNMITGWVHVSSLPEVANHTEVKQIRTIIPPVASGIPATTKTATSESRDFLPDGYLQYAGLSSITPDIPVSSGSGLIMQNASEQASDSRIWKEKLSTDLLQLLDDRYLSPGQSSGDAFALMKATGEVRSGPGNISEVMVSAHVTPGLCIASIQPYFTSAGSDSIYGRIAGWIPVANLSRLVKEPGIISVMAQIPPITSRIITEGDALICADEFRNSTNLTGAGVKVGIISDGVSSLDAIIAQGELPQDVHILRSSIGGDEGTAMLQIVHDIAPEAELFFHDRGSSQIEFVQAMDKLITAGCRIICDDITYVEPFFEDGYIARNIRDRVLSYGILYVTSAGNFAQEHYQAPFNGYMDRGYAWHDFMGSHGSKDLKFTAPPNTAGHIILQWDDRFSESSNNYDLFLYNSDIREIGRSVKIQDGDDDPMEYCRFVNSEETSQDFFLRVVQAGGENRTIEIYVLPLGGSPVSLDPCIPEDSMFGQQAVKEALSVGAISPAYNFTTSEPYSSRGPVTIKFPEPELREKPELSAPDGVTISIGSGFFSSFSGTSASAPHIAGLASLLWEAYPAMKEGEIREALINATADSTWTWDPSIGYGMPDARRLILLVQAAEGDLSVLIPQVNYPLTFAPREMEPAETVVLYPGWNMISIPFPLESGSDTGMMFSAVNTTSHSIWRYAGDNSHWTVVRDNDTLSHMDVIWVNSANRTELSMNYDDSRQNMTARRLTTGWNPLGLPGRSTLTACDLLAPLGNTWAYILVFDPRLQQFRPAIINGGIGAYSDERLLYPTEGFWIYMNAPGLIIP